MPSVLITGANRGIGLEFARQYAAEGWVVFASCRNPKAAKELANLVKRSGGKLTVVQMDVTDGESVRNAARQLGNEAIDLLINNAGISGIPGQRTGHIDYENWLRVLDVNTMGPLRVVEAFVDHIARSDRRLIVTITSGMGSIAENTSGGSIAYRT
jgi:NAD(P)-dependent dehydrogenase (short-subunit alcohol dehydrogenase family)